jgi:hypothetical protein
MQAAGLPRTCVTSMTINVNVFNGTVNCGGQYTLTHVIQTIEADSWCVGW